MEYILATVQRRRPLVSVSSRAMERPAALTETLSGLMMGLFPKTLLMTRDQLKMLAHDNVVSDGAIAEGRTLQGLGNEPRAIESVVPSYLYRFRKHGQFDRDSRLA